MMAMVDVEDIPGLMDDVRTISIFNKNIPVRKYGCKNWNREEPLFIEVPRVNLFVQVTNLCNANCAFCIYHGDNYHLFDIEKFEMILKELCDRKDFEIGKLNFTGGEPTLNKTVNLDVLVDICKRNIDWTRKPEVTLNTNGFHLESIVRNQDFLDCVGLSRHHYDDKINKDIFRTYKVPSSNELKNLISSLDNPGILQFRCNLIKGHIDSQEKMFCYMDHVLELGGFDCGFVTLMPNNNFCNKHQVDFQSLIQNSPNIIQVNQWSRFQSPKNTPYCQCANYVYSNDYGQMCKFYARHFCNNSNTDGVLVFDGKFLRHGFGGEIII